jgi:hypothetical protein
MFPEQVYILFQNLTFVGSISYSALIILHCVPIVVCAFSYFLCLLPHVVARVPTSISDSAIPEVKKISLLTLSNPNQCKVTQPPTCSQGTRNS